jgi:hypothetical protein
VCHLRRKKAYREFLIFGTISPTPAVHGISKPNQRSVGIRAAIEKDPKSRTDIEQPGSMFSKARGMSAQIFANVDDRVDKLCSGKDITNHSQMTSQLILSHTVSLSDQESYGRDFGVGLRIG